MSSALHVIILAAGEGKRMKSRTPKVLQRIAGRPMLAHVIDRARELGATGIHVVFGHAGDQVRAAFADDADLQWAEQAQQLGTGHAVQQAMPHLEASGDVLVLYGDVPLIRTKTLEGLVARAGDAGLALWLSHAGGDTRLAGFRFASRGGQQRRRSQTQQRFQPAQC